MIDQVAAAFDRQDYRTAAQLLKAWRKQSPQDPWVQFYIGRLHEVSGKLEAAETVFRQLLRDTVNPKLTAQARQGLQRLEAIQKARRQEAIAQATADPLNAEPGYLILEPIRPEDKSLAAQNLARIMKIDPYTARLQLPSRGWRLYRTGAIGELQLYGQELQTAGIPAFSAALAAVQKINVFRVNYFQSVAPQATVVCQNEADQLGSLTFDWSDVTQRVEGLLPIFEQVVDLDVHQKLQRKEQTQDYAQICDLHLPSRRCILRLCDSNYQFQQGVLLSASAHPQASAQGTTRRHWNSLIEFLNQQLPQVPVWSGFTTFAETVLDQTEMLSHIQPHIGLFRRTETDWDPAFQLYSALVFLRNNPIG